MLHSLTSSLSSFKTITFKPGMNFIIAEGDMRKDHKGTANSVGKSSIFYLIDYLLGGSGSDLDFSAAVFDGATFTLDATLGGARVQIKRSVDPALKNAVTITGDISSWDCLTDDQKREAINGLTIPNKQWATILGKILFGIPDSVPWNVAKKATPPTARELLTQLNRKSFANVVKSFARQGEEKGTLICLYLMNLNWNYLSTLIGLKKEEDLSKKIKATAEFKKEQLTRTRPSLMKDLPKMERALEKAEKDLAEYRVKNQIDLFLDSTNRMTEELRAKQREAVNTRRRIELAKASLVGITEDVEALKEFYKAVGIELSGSVKATLEKTCEFHKKIRGYRESTLKREIAANTEKLTIINADIERIDKERQEMIQSEEVRNTFADFNEKQVQLAALRRQVTELQQAKSLQQDAVREVDRINTIRTQLAVDEGARFDGYKDTIDDFSESFSSVIQDLYGEERIAPNFKVDFYDGTKLLGKKKPYTIKVHASISGDRGSGKCHTKVCVFDILLFKLARENDFAADFILHDSPAFESSDINQYAGFMRHAAKIVGDSNSQYISAIDSDRFNRVCAKHPKFAELVNDAHKINLSSSEKLFGVDF